MNKIINRINKLAEKTIYKFEELPSDIQEKVFEKELQCAIEFYNEDFQHYCNEQVEEIFPNSNINYTYNFFYDNKGGFGLFGDIDLCDALRLTNIDINEVEQEIISYVFDTIHINNDSHDTFFTNDMININISETDIQEAVSYFSDELIKNTNTKDLTQQVKKLEVQLKSYINKFCKEIADYGYEYLCPNDNIIIKLIEDKDAKYDKNGNEI